MRSRKHIVAGVASAPDETEERQGTNRPCEEPSLKADQAQKLTTGVVITHEDIDRAHDRERVFVARARRGIFSRFRLLWLLVGPGMLVMLGENDGPSMLSYAATGSRFGVGFFIPFVVLTFFMALVVQEMTVRLGSATHRGHAELIFDRFGPFWGWFSMIDLGIGNFLTLITEFIAIRAGLGFFGVPPWAAILSALAVLYLALVTHRYWTWERFTLVAAAFNLVFVPVALLTRPHWDSVGHALGTWTPLPGGLTKDTVLILLADIGATVTPWMLFFQQSATVDKGLTKGDVQFGRIDTALGAALAATAAVATILATAPLFGHHMSAENFQAAEFAQALRPLIGRFGAALFALGIVEAGMVACITISTSSAYAFGEVAHRPHSLNLPLRQGKSFYLVLFLCAAAAGAIVLIPGLPLVYVVLVVNVIAVLAMPPALVFLFMLANDREIMGDLVTSPLVNVLASGVVIFLTLAGILFGISVIAPNLFAFIGGK
ncbi:MAG TPA: NRAMP family divalent metal transporter [Candidatus Dormibacteraeota bacterium]|nr:NRAMP family divalent metal transporter [Candidatus Dormibacteraeota bacterium]